MAVRGTDEWETDNKFFADAQVEAVIEALEVRIVSETETVFLCACPFHNNPGSPAFAINKESGLYYCHNPSCNEKGTLNQLVRKIKEVNTHEAKRLINKHQSEIDYVKLAERALEPVEFKDFNKDHPDLLNRMRDNFSGSEGEDYMFGRGFTSETLDHFEIGWSEKQRAVVVPMHTDTGLAIGFVARFIDEKGFKNSFGLQKSKTAWNMHRAKAGGGTGIVTESAFDSMLVHQAGYPNTIALLGSGVNRITQQQMERYFSTVVIMTDNDELQFRKDCQTCRVNCIGHNPGRVLGQKIEEMVRRKIMWATWSDDEIYPHAAKDAGDLTRDEIIRVLSNAVGSGEYHEWFGYVV